MRYKICWRCGSCCSDLLPISDIEIAVIRAYVQTHGIKDEQPDKSACPFLRRRSCAIYSVRPQICREYHCKLSHDQFVDVALRRIRGAKAHSMRATFYGQRATRSVP